MLWPSVKVQHAILTVASHSVSVVVVVVAAGVVVVVAVSVVGGPCVNEVAVSVSVSVLVAT